MGALDVEVVEQPGRVAGHVCERVRGTSDVSGEELAPGRRRRSGEVRRASAVAVVEADHVEATRGEPFAELLGPGDHLKPEPHDEQQGGVVWVAERLVAELDPGGGAELLVDLGHGETVAGERRVVIGWGDQSAWSYGGLQRAA